MAVQSLKVLIVDDEPGLRTGALRVLRNFKPRFAEFPDEEVAFECQEAANVAGALAGLSGKPDLLLLDYKLPDGTGLEVLARLTPGERPLAILITAFATLEVAIAATRRGAYDFLAKPFTPEELRATLEKAVRHLLLQRRARAFAEEKRKIRFQFLSVLAHELKSPIAAIEGYLNIMKDQTLGARIDEYAAMVDRCQLRLDGMRKLILDLLDLTRIESGQKSRQLETLDLVPLLREAEEAIRQDAGHRRLRVEIQAPASLPFHCDRGEMQIIFNNLLSNAVKYNVDDGAIHFRLEAVPGSGVKIECRDVGVGMKKEDIGRLFGEFVRIKNEKTRGVPGTGLGLSILKKLVGLYNGNITVESEPEKGSRFLVVLNGEPIESIQPPRV